MKKFLKLHTAKTNLPVIINFDKVKRVHYNKDRDTADQPGRSVIEFDNYDEMDDLTYMHVKEPVELIFSMLENDK